jgi:hypothetical protein
MDIAHVLPMEMWKEKRCANCSAVDSTKQCKCRLVYYCGLECYNAHWSEHEPHCWCVRLSTIETLQEEMQVTLLLQGAAVQDQQRQVHEISVVVDNLINCSRFDLCIQYLSVSLEAQDVIQDTSREGWTMRSRTLSTLGYAQFVMGMFKECKNTNELRRASVEPHLSQRLKKVARALWERSIRETSLMMHCGKHKWGWDILQCRMEFLSWEASAVHDWWPSPSEELRMRLAHYAYLQECGPESGLKFYKDANIWWAKIHTLMSSMLCAEIDIGAEVSEALTLQTVSCLMLESENMLNNNTGRIWEAPLQIERYDRVKRNLIMVVQILRTIGDGKHYKIIDVYRLYGKYLLQIDEQYGTRGGRVLRVYRRCIRMSERMFLFKNNAHKHFSVALAYEGLGNAQVVYGEGAQAFRSYIHAYDIAALEQEPTILICRLSKMILHTASTQMTPAERESVGPFDEQGLYHQLMNISQSIRDAFDKDREPDGQYLLPQR